MKKGIKFYEYGIQLILVIVGVFLGMLASEWNASNKLKSAQKEILHNIKLEIESNMTIVKSAQKNKIKFFRSLDSLYPTLTKEVKDELLFDNDFNQRFPNWKGIGDAQLSNAMFEVAKFSNMLSSMDIDIASQLSKTYTIQESFKDTRVTFINKLFDFNSKTTYGDGLRFMSAVRKELGSFEEGLLRQYTKTLELLQE